MIVIINDPWYWCQSNDGTGQRWLEKVDTDDDA